MLTAVWAIRHPDRGWLVDDCAGGTWRHMPPGVVENDASIDALARTFATEREAWETLEAADIPRDGCVSRKLLVKR